MWTMTGAEGVNDASADMATTQAALKGAPRRLQVLKEPRACANDAVATAVLTRGLVTRDGIAVDLRAVAPKTAVAGWIDQATADRFGSQMRKQSPAHVLTRPPGPCSVQADSCPGPFGQERHTQASVSNNMGPNTVCQSVTEETNNDASSVSKQQALCSTSVVTALPWTCCCRAFLRWSAGGRCRNRKLCLLAAAPLS